MAALVGNLLRRLKEFPMDKVDTRIAEELHDIEEAFSLLLPHLQNAERELLNYIRMDLQFAEGNDHLYDEWSLLFADWYLQDAEWGLHEQQWIRSNACFDISELRNSIIRDTWPWLVAVWAADVEEIVISYNFHLPDLNTRTHYSKFLNSYPFMSDSNNLAAKIRNYLPIHSWSIRASRMIQVLCPIDQSSAEDCVLLLGKVSEVLTSPEMTELLQKLKRTISPQPQPEPVGNFFSNNDSRINQIRMNLESTRMVGREKEVELHEGWLLENEEESPDIITIVGEAGIGKTTVAEAVYERVQKHFDCHAWVFVSRNDSTRHIMKKILKGILKSISVMAPNNIDSMGEKPLKKLINSWLIGKKFLLILDDAPSWEIVEEVMSAIPRGSKTTRILVTSRVLNQHSHCTNECNLNPIYSSELLHEHACSSERSEEFLSSVKSVAEKIARLCRGLPLAIVTVGRMLSTKHTAEDWIEVHQMFLRGASFMSLCYADLSPALQSCFLYASSFPCHFEISSKKLKRLWIAEGFVQHDNNRTLEESAQLQLEELIHRNMIQVVKRNIDGRVKSCRILRRMREFALKRAEGDHFTVILKSLKNTIPEKCHRAFLYGASYNGTPTSKFSRKDFSRLYSFLALEQNQHQAPLSLNDFRLLCVLELQGFCHELLPDAVGDLALLRYLGLRSGKIKKLPVSIRKLCRLQTLDIRDTFIRDLPDDLEGLGKLRHLLLEGSFTDKVVNLKDGIIEAFKDLQTLAGLKMTEAIAKELIHLRGIRKLSIGGVQGFHLVPLFKAVERMEFLRSFTMKGSFEDQSCKIPFPRLYSLEKVCIGGPMKNDLLDGVGKLHYVKSLYLWDSKLTKDPLLSLQHLSNLIILSLCNSYDGENIEFGDRGFPELKKLSILNCPKLQNWKEITDGAMTKLESLNLGYCPSLVELPKGLEKLNSLCSIQISNMSAQFMQDVYELQSVSKVSVSIQGTVQATPKNNIRRQHNEAKQQADLNLNQTFEFV